MKKNRISNLFKMLVIAGLPVLTGGFAPAQLELPWETDDDKNKGKIETPSTPAAAPPPSVTPIPPPSSRFGKEKILTQRAANQGSVTLSARSTGAASVATIEELATSLWVSFVKFSY